MKPVCTIHIRIYFFFHLVVVQFFQPKLTFLEITELTKQLQDSESAVAELQEGAKLKFQQRKQQDEEHKKMLEEYKTRIDEAHKDLFEKDAKVDELTEKIEAYESKINAITEILAKK
ncbi:hypothetical protein M1146_04785 [Patescibacteria group bacterium]|nr:hypothetical protein [Patescibacteria group bacterium]